MSDGALILLNGIARGFYNSIVGMVRVYQMDQQQNDEADSGEGSAGEETPTVLARRRAARKKTVASSTKDSPPKVMQRILLCCAWNGGLFWLSILLFYNLIIPALHYCTHVLFGSSGTENVVWAYMSPMLSATFSALWVLPLFVLSKVVNGFWFQDIADAAYRKRRGRPQLPGLGKVIADILFSLLLQSLFLIQALLARMLPIHGLGDFISLLHMCLLYSLYAFEYKWFNMGWEVHKRLSYIECNWPYFIGFGLPLSIATSLPTSFVVSGCVFSIFFPLFIVSANEAELPPETYDFPLRLFSVVVTLSNLIFRRGLAKPVTNVSSTVSTSAGLRPVAKTTPKKVTMK